MLPITEITDQAEMRRRIRAARELTPPTDAELDQRAGRGRQTHDPGYGLTQEELAARIHVEGFGPKTLGAIERGERLVKPHEVEWVAAACNLPLEFFKVDFRTLSATQETVVADNDVVSDLRSAVDNLSGQMELLAKIIGAQVDQTRTAIDATRKLKRTAAGRASGGSAGKKSAANTRGGADAKKGSAQAPARTKRANG